MSSYRVDGAQVAALGLALSELAQGVATQGESVRSDAWALGNAAASGAFEEAMTHWRHERLLLAASLDDPAVTLSIVNGNYALEAGLVPANDALILESAEGNPYANVLVTKETMKDDPRVQKLAEALESPELAKFIVDNYQGSVLPVNG